VFETHDPGTTTVIAHDPVTGMQASATLTVGWTLRRIVVSPSFVQRSIGGRARFEAIGEFTGGRTVTLTDRVQFAVSDAAIARVDTEAEHPGEVVALDNGTSAIVACDQRSAICSANARLQIFPGGGTRYLVPSPFGVSVLPGRGADVAVWEFHTSGGWSEVVSRTVEVAVDPPSVARVAREGATGLRVYGIQPGRAEIQLDHDGVRTSFSVTVYGPLTSLYAYVEDPFGVGTSAFASAWGWDANGSYRRMTSAVEWRSLDPAIAVMAGDAEHPNRIDGLAPGTARIVARDPASGLESPPAPVLVYGALARVDTVPNDGEGDPIVTTQGSELYFQARASYEGGYVRCMACRNPRRAARFESSNPSVLKVLYTSLNYAAVRAVGLGEATITAVDEETGVTGVGMTIQVRGQINRLELQPAPGVVRGIGEREWLTAIGHFPPGVTANLTQSVWYESSNPDVAVVSNDWRQRGEVTTVGAGTAVISAHYGSLSSTHTGDDVSVTVLPGRLERIVVSPSLTRRMVGESEEFTAVGYYADGTTLNVTQQVEWQIGDSSVAGAFGPPNRRSLIEGAGPGTTTITAVHPSGVSSAMSNESAVMEVDAVIDLDIEPGPRTLLPGQTEELTVTAQLASGETRNVTQLADYVAWPLEPVVVQVPNAAPRKSRLQAVAPGETEVVVSFAGQTERVTMRVIEAF
jgi:hypothetical protein